MPKYDTPINRFWVGVHKTDCCWIWTKGTFDTGYGQLWVKGRPEGTHRLSWEIHFGPIPKEKCVLHRYDNRLCVRPDHLFLGTRTDNNADMRKKDRHARGDRVANKGERNGNSKLTWKDVRIIRKRLAFGETQTTISKCFRVHHSLISLIDRNIIWVESSK